jgi:hypothetical protein
VTAVLYRIDREDTIVETGGAWDDFARANGGVPPAIERPLWHFIAGKDVRATWALLLRRVREGRIPVAFLYRCDGPGVRRLMQMELLADGAGSVQFRSTAVSVVETETVVGRWETGSARDTVLVCGWCGRVHAGNWVQPERAIHLLGLHELRQPRLSHGICDSCAGELKSAASA